MKKIFLPALMAALAFAGCSKTGDGSDATDFNATKDQGIADFVNKVALPSYAQLKANAATLNSTINTLNETPSEANLTAAKNAWKDMRGTWEKCEGFLFGPVDEFEYDPETDTWPVNHTDLDALLADMSHPLTVPDIEGLTSRSLKGYHPVEYILWGTNGTRTAASLTAREKKYAVSLSAALKIQADDLYTSWISSGGNYSNTFLMAGAGSSVYTKKQDAYVALVNGMVGICGEVGDGKMKEPFDVAATDPAGGAQLVESPFSGNSISDFKNNIIGAYNVYKGNFTADGKGLQDLVKMRNNALNAEIEQKFNVAINSFDNITVPFERAISTQRTQCQATMSALADLSSTLETKLGAFVIQYITD